MIGAFGAHALGDRLHADALATFDIAGRYHFVHTLALALAALAPAAGAGRARCVAAAWTWLVGMLVFCGSLYLLAVTGANWLGAITPLGGLALIAGWALFALAAFGRRSG